jgi:hypothetical protein
MNSPARDAVFAGIQKRAETIGQGQGQRINEVADSNLTFTGNPGNPNIPAGEGMPAGEQAAAGEGIPTGSNNPMERYYKKTATSFPQAEINPALMQSLKQRLGEPKYSLSPSGKTWVVFKGNDLYQPTPSKKEIVKKMQFGDFEATMDKLIKSGDISRADAVSMGAQTALGPLQTAQNVGKLTRAGMQGIVDWLKVNGPKDLGDYDKDFKKLDPITQDLVSTLQSIYEVAATDEDVARIFGAAVMAVEDKVFDISDLRGEKHKKYIRDIALEMRQKRDEMFRMQMGTGTVAGF